MNLVRFQNPRYVVNRNLTDELLSNFLRNDYHENYLEKCGNQPATNVFETEQDFRIELLLPGFGKDEVQMNVQKNVLTIKVDKQNDKENGNENHQEEFKYARREFGTFSFEKTFRIPQTVDIEHINARFENGILYVNLPKKEEALEKEPREIAIS